MKKADLKIQLNLLSAQRDATEFELQKILHTIRLLSLMNNLPDDAESPEEDPKA